MSFAADKQKPPKAGESVDPSAMPVQACAWTGGCLELALDELEGSDLRSGRSFVSGWIRRAGVGFGFSWPAFVSCLRTQQRLARPKVWNALVMLFRSSFWMETFR